HHERNREQRDHVRNKQDPSMVAVELADLVDGVIGSRGRPSAERSEQDEDDEDDGGDATPSHESVRHRNLHDERRPAGAPPSLAAWGERYDACSLPSRILKRTGVVRSSLARSPVAMDRLGYTSGAAARWLSSTSRGGTPGPRRPVLHPSRTPGPSAPRSECRTEPEPLSRDRPASSNRPLDRSPVR